RVPDAEGEVRGGHLFPRRRSRHADSGHGHADGSGASDDRPLLPGRRHRLPLRKEGHLMHLPVNVNYLAVLVSGLAIFFLGGLWYSPVLFAKPWTRLMGKSEEPEARKAMPVMYALAFVTGVIIAWTLAVVVNHFPPVTIAR